MNSTKYIFFVVIVLHVFAMISAPKPQPSVQTSPERFKKTVETETPVKRARLTLKHIDDVHGRQLAGGRVKDSVLGHATNVAENLAEASAINPVPRPSYPREIIEIASDTQQTVVGRFCSLENYGTRSFFDQYRTNILGTKKHAVFKDLAKYSDLGYISAHHAIDGDPGNGGQHFIRNVADYDAFVNATSVAGRPVLRNGVTGVEYGAGLRSGYSRTVLNCTGLTSDDDITQTIAAIARGGIPMIGYTENTAFAIIPEGLPLAGQAVELYFSGTDVCTFYPIFSFAQWSPDQPLNVVTYDVLTAGAAPATASIVMTSTEALLFAQTMVSSYNSTTQPYCPLAYVTDRGTLIFDFAPALQAAGTIAVERGIYVEFPQSEFNRASLQAAFPTHF